MGSHERRRFAEIGRVGRSVADRERERQKATGSVFTNVISQRNSEAVKNEGLREGEMEWYRERKREREGEREGEGDD